MTVRAGIGRNGQATLAIDCAHGRATIYLQGAHVTSWIPTGGAEVLFVSEAARFAPQAAIRGGVPIAFPQFAELGPLPMHGFAHVARWEWSGGGEASARLTLRDSDRTRALWPHRFVARLSVALRPGTLALRLAVFNPGTAPLAWSGTLHTFLALDAPQVRIRGLGPGPFVDRGRGSRPADDPAPELRIPGHTDRVYLDAGPRVAVDDGRRRLVVAKRGFRDTVVWNPGPETSARFADLRPDEHTAFVCVEAAEVRPVSVPPGATWQGGQTLRLAPS